MEWHVLKIDGNDVLSPRELADVAAVQQWPADFYGSANAIWIPIGFDPGVASLIVPRSTMQALDPDGFHTLAWQQSRGGSPHTTEFRNWTICDARIQGIDGDEKAAYLITLRDSRQILQRAAVVNQSYNVSVPHPCGITVEDRQWLENTLNGESLWTWQEMLADVWGLLPASAGAVPVLPWHPTHKPDTWRFHGIQAWEAVRMICDACQVTIRPVNGGLSYELVNLGTPQDLSALSGLVNRLLRDEKPKDPCGCELPGNVSVCFPTRPIDHCDRSLRESHEEEPVYAATPTSTGLACAGLTQHSLRYDLVGEIDCDQTLVNQAQLESSAAAIGARVAARLQTATDFHRVYSGICHEIQLGANIHEIHYRDLGDESGCVTQAIGHLRWGLPSEAWTRPARECILPGQGGQVQPQQWNAESECWEDSDDDPIEIIDPMGWLLAVVGDCFKVDMSGVCSGPPQPSFPFGMTQMVKVTEPIDCGECGLVTITRRNFAYVPGGGDHCRTAVTACQILACNMSFRKLGCDAPEFALAHIIPGTCCLPDGSGEEEAPRCLAFLMPYPRPMRAHATLTSKLCGDEAAAISSVEYKDVCKWEAAEDPDAAKNPLHLYACEGDEVELAWSEDECEWEIVAVPDHVLEKPLLDLRCKDGECTLEGEKLTEDFVGHTCDCDQETDWEDVLQGDYIDVVQRVTGDVFAPSHQLESVQCVGTCTMQFTRRVVANTSLEFRRVRLCVFCGVEDTDEEESQESPPHIEEQYISAVGSVVEPVELVGTEVDVLVDLSEGPMSGLQDMLVGAECGTDSEDCWLYYPTENVIQRALMMTKRTLCVFCGVGAPQLPNEGPDMLRFNGEGLPAVIQGQWVDVIDDLEFDAGQCEGGYYGGGSLTITGKTKSICVFCGVTEGANKSIDLPFEATWVLDDAYLHCDPCPELDIRSKQVYVLCPDSPAWEVAGGCECTDCEEEEEEEESPPE